MKLSLSFRLLLSRFLTRSGDQAWDFAVPLILLRLYPGQIRVAAIYYLIIRVATSLLIPQLASTIDRVNRMTAARLGILLQLVGVAAGGLIIFLNPHHFAIAYSPLERADYLNLAYLTIAGILSSLGSSLMDISIANDLVPSAFDKEALPAINARLRQVDLLTEIGAPVLTGFILLLSAPTIPLLGFYVIALWNVLSFLPEYSLLSSIFRTRPDLNDKISRSDTNATKNLFQRFSEGWTAFFREPVALAVFAYSLLWLSVLSPHGVLLTGYLKDEWKMPESTIGIYRALGAVFGLGATFLYPRVVKALGLVKGSRMFIQLQSTLLLVALGFFLLGGHIGELGFLGFVLLSRVALYAFSLGEMQIRQEWISPAKRGEVNGFASALTGIATLGLYGAGALLPATSDFHILIYGSVGAVVAATFVFSFWTKSADRSSSN